MKITSFNPLIVTPEPEKLAQLFEELGFERKHNTKNAGKDEMNICDIRMSDPNGFHVDIASTANTKQDLTIIRMNVDDFDEAYDFLISKGFTNPTGTLVENSYSKSTLMKAPSGFGFDLCHHKREHDQKV